MLKILTTIGATALLLVGLVAAAANDRTEICKRMLGAMADGHPEQVADLMLESAPRLDTKNEAGVEKLRAGWRQTYEHSVRSRGGVTDRASQPAQNVGGQTAVIERWQLGNGEGRYAGCVQHANGKTWVTNLEISPQVETVVAKLRDATATTDPKAR